MKRKEAILCLTSDCQDCEEWPECNSMEKINAALHMAQDSLQIYDIIIADIKKACGCNTALDIINEHLEELEGKYGE